MRARRQVALIPSVRKKLRWCVAGRFLPGWPVITRDLRRPSADRHEGTDPDSPGNLMVPGDYDFGYDPIGNRLSQRVDSDPARRYYCTNTVNQYQTIDDGSTCPPQSADESLTYDDDGNLTADGTHTFVWDGENRLKAVYPTSPASVSKKLMFTYDYMSRRVCKQVFAWDTQTTDWADEAETDLRFVYDGWNVVLVLDGRDLNEDEQPDNTVVRKYTWGLDLSGTLHGAGGVGGLLAFEEPQSQGDPKRYWFFYDGNGNVVQILKYTAGSPPTVTLAAHYEYDPYGHILLKNDVDSSGLVNANQFRFSTKWLDTDLAGPNVKGAVGPDGMYYYGYRYYSPRLGRWISRDPIARNHGIFNLTAVRL